MQTFTNTTKVIYFGSLFGAIRMLIGGVSALYLISKGVSLQEIGVLKSFQAAMIFIFDIPLAYVADKNSKIFSIRLAVIFSSIWLLITATANSFNYFLLAEFFNAISLALFNGAFIAHLLSKTNNNNKKFILSRYTKVQHILMSLAALIGPMMIVKVSSPNIWFYSSALMIILYISSFLLLSKKEDTKEKQENINIPNILNDLKKSFHTIVAIKRILLSIIIFGLFYQVLIQYWQPVLKSIGKLSDDAYIWGMIFFSILLLQSFSGYIAEKHHQKIIKSILLSLSLLITTWIVTDNQGFYYSVLIINIFFISRFIAIKLTSIFHESISDEYRSTLESIRSTITSLCVIITIPLAGLLIETAII